MTTNSISLFAKDYAKTCIMRGRKNTRRAVMILAHAIRTKASMIFGGTPGEYSISVAMIEAWHAIKAENLRKSISARTNVQGFVVFEHRSNTTGDRHSWARLNGDFTVRDHHVLTISIADEPMSAEYAVEMAAFCTTYNVTMPKAGQRVTVTL